MALTSLSNGRTGNVRRREIERQGMSTAEALAALDAILEHATAPQITVSPVDPAALLAGSRLEHEIALIDTGQEAADAELQDRPALPNEYVAPTTDVAQRMSAVWSRALGVSRVGVRDNFLELGGDSLLAIQLIALINEELGTQLSVADIYEGLTVEHLAARAEPRDDTDEVDLQNVQIRKEAASLRRKAQERRRAARSR
jgi:acyl carrier protein